MRGSGNRKTDGTTTKTTTIHVNKMKCRGTVWDYLNAGDKNKLKNKHPAVFPDKIPYDLINCFCPPDGIVLDPFVGSGSTCVMAKKLKRNYTGIDISKNYINIAKERMKEVQIELNISWASLTEYWYVLVAVCAPEIRFFEKDYLLKVSYEDISKNT